MSHFCLQNTADGYTLVPVQGNIKGLKIDFRSSRLARRRHDGGRELLARAVKAKPGWRVFDATAGLGVDSFVLASRGCRVTLAERSHTLWLMLEDALARARSDAATAGIAERMTLIRGDAGYLMAHLDFVPDAITIDPMFPERRKRAEVRGELQLMQQLIGKDENVKALLAAAFTTGCRRIVVKRPLHGGEIVDRPASFSVKGKASRFDVYVR